MTWLPEVTNGADAFEGVFGLRPNLFAAWRGFEALLWEDGRVDPMILALCRRRLASMNGASGVVGSPGPAIGAARLAALDAWWKSDRFTPLEQACLRFAEQYAVDPGGITEADAAAVTEALGDAGTVAFVEALAIFDGFSRFCAMLDVAAHASGEPVGARGGPNA